MRSAESSTPDAASHGPDWLGDLTIVLTGQTHEERTHGPRNHDTPVPGSANRRWLPGHVSAGRVLEWIDKAGYACAVAWSGSYSVTAYVGNVSFTRPVQVGDIVEAAADCPNWAKQHEHPGHRPIRHHRLNPIESVDRVLADSRCNRR